MAMGLCKLCQQEKKLLYFSLCDKCYRTKIMNTYSYYRLNKEYKGIDKVKNEKHRKILRMVLWYNKSFREISDVLEIPQRTVCWVVNKYCYRCDVYGNPRPIEFCGKYKNK